MFDYHLNSVYAHVVMFLRFNAVYHLAIYLLTILSPHAFLTGSLDSQALNV